MAGSKGSDGVESAGVDAAVRFLLSPSAAFVSGESVRVEQRGAAAVAAAGQEEGCAVVTGAARGIGQQIAFQLAESESSRFSSVLAVDQGSFGEGYALGSQGKIRALQADVTDDAGLLGRLEAHVREHRAPIKALVLNAGITRDGLFRKMTAAEFEQVLSVNLTSIVRLVERLAEGRLLADHARITLLSSINGVSGAAGQTNYAMTKSALIGYARVQARLMGSRGITVNCVAPGFIETAMTKAMSQQAYLFASLTNALGQAGLPEDIANAVEFLSSPQAGGISGQTLRVCGLHMTGR
ncbi:MAG: SDR family oxidoreductase [archaeon]|nr:SDR family oxidoreductase [archaeon]